MLNLSDFRGKKICVAVSGGIDSVCLLHYIKSLEEECGYSISAVHCEHGIRGEESLSDMRFTLSLCEKWGIPAYVFKEDCIRLSKEKKMSLETVARTFRYSVFERLLKEGKADYIALAHHKNDEAETVLFRLARGTSLTGVGGMVELNGQYLRPFLSWTRREIEEYAEKNGLEYREDKTNEERDATRNRLRLDVLPVLEDAVHGATENLARFASLAVEDDKLLYEYAQTLLTVKEDEERGVVVSVKECPKKPLLRRACLLALKTLGVERDYTAIHIENASSLLTMERGARQTMPQGIEAKRVEGGLEFYRVNSPISIPKGEPQPFGENGFDGGRYEITVQKEPFAGDTGKWKILVLDGDKIPVGAGFRFRKEGDEIRRFGGGLKTLKKFFNEKKIPVEEREYLPLIADLEGKTVYAVCGVEISEEVKITKETQNALYITIRKK
ncbi:MAG: tRNA lysidine(34) synthetase TilS [Clostridia bacterium]|nr:tRNA lysidine(34) synthetase TilS [Clostridia bacterium]